VTLLLGGVAYRASALQEHDLGCLLSTIAMVWWCFLSLHAWSVLGYLILKERFIGYTNFTGLRLSQSRWFFLLRQ
ncbi:unnamed protein product, partial [Brassica oleracea]